MPQNTKQLKTRIKSVNSTMHITKAMELVASSKLRRATENMEASRPYFDALSSAVPSLSKADSIFSKPSEEKHPLYVVVAGDRGLAGGYNNNIYKLLKANTDGKAARVIPIGKRMAEYAAKHGYDALKSFPSVEDFSVADSANIGKSVKDEFAAGNIDAVFIVYTKYVSMLSQTATVKKILPVECEDDAEKKSGETLFEPSAEAVIDAAVPEYVSGMVYGAVCESFASELSARRNAMDNATQNAEEMIDTLELRYNRARQSAITQEITEIIGGSES